MKILVSILIKLIDIFVGAENIDKAKLISLTLFIGGLIGWSLVAFWYFDAKHNTEIIQLKSLVFDADRREIQAQQLLKNAQQADLNDIEGFASF